MQGAFHQTGREEFAVIPCLKQQCSSFSEVFNNFCITLYPWGTSSPPDRPTSPPTPSHRAWRKETQNKNPQLHSQKRKKEQLLLRDMSKWKKYWWQDKKKLQLCSSWKNGARKWLIKMLKGDFKNQRLPPWVENSGYQKSHSPPGRSWDTFPGPKV